MELFAYDFVQRGLLTGVLVSVICGIVGVFLLLRRMAFFGAGLSHAAFGGIALSMLLETEPFLFTAIFTVVIANVVQFLTSHKKVSGDGAIALVFSGGVALAVIILSVVRGFREHLFGFLFGSVLMVTEEELLFTLALFFLVLLFLGIYYRKLILLSFSEELAKLRGINVKLMNHTLVSVASLVVVLSIKVVGVLLASSLLVIPSMTALLIARSFKGTVILSVLVAVISVLSGMYVALLFDLPPSGTIVGFTISLFASALLWRRLRVSL